jgi:hypothetical protein
MHNNFVVVIEGFLDPKDILYNLCDFPKDPIPTTLIAQTDNQTRLLLDLVAQRYFCIGSAQHAEVTEHISP